MRVEDFVNKFVLRLKLSKINVCLNLNYRDRGATLKVGAKREGRGEVAKNTFSRYSLYFFKK